MIGKILNHYKIIRQLGSGAMGEVYLAEDTSLDRQVALKVLPADLASDPERRQRFEREAKAIAALDHPNIVTVHSVEEAQASDSPGVASEAEGEPLRFITMQLVEGKTLSELIPSDGFPLEKFFDLAIPLADAVSTAHEHGIIHRDLKPANIMVSDGGWVSVLDFGLAKLREDTSSAPGTRTEQESELPTVNEPEYAAASLTEEGKILGTVAYMSPEQAEGKSVEEATDIFSLGIILYEMATGERPFKGDTKMSVMSSIIKDTPVSVIEHNHHLPRHLARIIRLMLEKEPDRRLQSAKGVRNQLEELRREVQSGEVGAAGVSHSAGTRARGGRRVAAAALGAVTLLALLFGLNIGGVRDRLLGTGPAAESMSVNSLAVLPFENLSGDPAQDYIADGLTYELIAELGRVTKVTNPSSAMQFKEERPSLSEIAQALGVEGVLEASMLSSGGRVRITAQLYHGATETPLWSASFEEDAADVFSLLGNLSREISREIEVAISAGEDARLARSRPVDPGALDAYLRGQQLLARRSMEDDKEALDLFKMAAEIEPTFALAHAGQAHTYASLAQGLSAGMAPGEGYSLAKAAAMVALELDETRAEPHASLGFIATFFDWDWEAAESEFLHAIDLNPSYARAHFLYSLFLCTQGRFDEAQAEINRAYELDPLDAQINLNRVTPMALLGRSDEAIMIEREVLDIYPDSALGHYFLGADLLEVGMNEQAIEELEMAASLSQEYVGILGYAYARVGRREEALEILEQLQVSTEERRVSPEEIARIHTWLGDIDQAFFWLERAFAERTSYLPYMRFDPFWKPLRSDPRFDDLLARLGLVSP